MPDESPVAERAELQAPFPWFGGKRRVAHLVWSRFGRDVANYVEPFFGSGAVLLARPEVDLDDLPLETANDADGFVCNLWRAMAREPDAVAEHADRLVHECDLQAAHVWLRAQRAALHERLEADLSHCDAKIAGLWVWGQCLWIGSGWCGPSGAGPWRVEDGRLVKGDAGQGVKRARPQLGNAGKGVQRQLPHLGDAGKGVQRKRPVLAGPAGGMRLGDNLGPWFAALSARLRRVRFCCGDWARVTGPSVTFKHGPTGVFLDPPYDMGERDAGCYAVDTAGLSERVRVWCTENGANPLLRIALCGYAGEGHEALETLGWRVQAWKAHGGYASQGDERGRENAHRERIWFSPACLSEAALAETGLLHGLDAAKGDESQCT